MTAAANILLHGAERLKMSQSDTVRAKSNQDFHLELLRLRQNWTLKKVGNAILGDLSYKSAGSRFHHTGIFEVTKSEDHTQGSSADIITENLSKPSMIKITVPTELEGTAYIQVTIQKGKLPNKQNRLLILNPRFFLYRSGYFMPHQPKFTSRFTNTH